MKRIVVCGWSLAAVVVSLGLLGCGGAGIEEGPPPSLKPDAPLDPKMVDFRGHMSPKAAAAANKGAQDAQKKTTPPAEEPAKKE